MSEMPSFSDLRQRVADAERLAARTNDRLAELVARTEQHVIDGERRETEAALAHYGNPMPKLSLP